MSDFILKLEPDDKITYVGKKLGEEPVLATLKVTNPTKVVFYLWCSIEVHIIIMNIAYLILFNLQFNLQVYFYCTRNWWWPSLTVEKHSSSQTFSFHVVWYSYCISAFRNRNWSALFWLSLFAQWTTFCNKNWRSRLKMSGSDGRKMLVWEKTKAKTKASSLHNSQWLSAAQ